jgi:N-acetylmuramoyl-L-alanine amidase
MIIPDTEKNLYNFKQIKKNRTRVWNRKIEYIVIHDTENPRNGANAEMHFQYFNNAYRGSSADFLVDETQVLQINDYNLYRSWHCGDGRGKFGVTNNNSIGIEICINQDGDFEQTLRNTFKLVKELMKVLNLTSDKVVRHFDASKKICPSRFSKNNWSAWEVFKKAISKSQFEIDIEELQKRGIINSVAFWIRESKKVQYFDTLINNFVNYLKNKGV